MPNFRSNFLDALRVQEVSCSPPILEEAERDQLLEAFRRWQNPPKFQPGDIIRQHPSCSCYHEVSANKIAIVRRYLSSPIPTDPAYTDDLEIMQRDSEGDMIAHVVESWRWEKI